MPKTAIIIPSRYGSTRLARKALHLIRGITLVERVYRRCLQANGIHLVTVATDHEEIANHVRAFGGSVIMTSPECPSGTDRVAAASQSLEGDYDIVINVQGDEPLLEPDVISLLARTMHGDRDVEVSTPITPILNAGDLINPNVVKVVRARSGDALYFSRNQIPYLRDHALLEPHQLLLEHPFWKHIGIYAYRRDALARFASLAEGGLERAERLEQLRLLEAGIPIRCVEVQYESVAVDTIEDVRTVEAIIEREGLD